MAFFKRLFRCSLIIVLLALALSCRPTQQHGSEAQAALRASVPVSPHSNTTVVSQEKVVSFPKIGNVLIQVVEADYKESKLVFTEKISGKELLVFYPWNNTANDFLLSDPTRPILRFRILLVKGLPSPLLLVVAISPAGSDTGFDNGLIGYVDGKLKVLTEKLSQLPYRNTDWPNNTELQSKETNPLSCGEQGGIFVGKLGKGLGTGIAIWQFIWGEQDYHYDSHRYDVRLCTYDAQEKQFKFAVALQTKKKHGTGKAALTELGLSHYQNMLNNFPELVGHRDNLE